MCLPSQLRIFPSHILGSIKKFTPVPVPAGTCRVIYLKSLWRVIFNLFSRYLLCYYYSTVASVEDYYF